MRQNQLSNLGRPGFSGRHFLPFHQDYSDVLVFPKQPIGKIDEQNHGKGGDLAEVNFLKSSPSQTVRSKDVPLLPAFPIMFHNEPNYLFISEIINWPARFIQIS